MDEQVLIDGGHALEFSRFGKKVEVHHVLVSRYLGFEIAEEDLWASVRSVTCLGSSLRVIAPHHELLFLCAHGAKHEWERIRWICDVAQLLDRMPKGTAGQVVKLATRLHAALILVLGLRLAREIMHADTKVFDAQMPRYDRRVRYLLRRVRGNITRDANSTASASAPIRRYPQRDALIFWIRSRERIRDQAACVVNLASLPTRSSDRSGSLWRITRPFKFAVRGRRPRA
jgi:hypothetical protein